MTAVELLKQKYKVEMAGSKIKVKPFTQWTWKAYPIENNDYVLVTEDEFIGLVTKVYQFNKSLNAIEPFNIEELINSKEGN